MEFEISPKKRVKELATRIATDYHMWYVGYCNGIIILVDNEEDMPFGYKTVKWTPPN